ncbi:glycosyl transferase [Klebsiella pneumoniae]|nr:glycosyl transferase [Klebsiella pneumoniae]
MKYTALIVTFNRLGKLKKTVEETLKLEFTNIVIVNNGSTDGTQAWLSSIVDTRVIVLTLAENTGGAGGFKTGSQYICEQLASDWVFFYDDDAYPYPDTLKSFSQLDKRGCRVFREGANKQVISSQADSLIKISRIWADFFPANTSNQPI